MNIVAFIKAIVVLFVFIIAIIMNRHENRQDVHGYYDDCHGSYTRRVILAKCHGNRHAVRQHPDNQHDDHH